MLLEAKSSRKDNRVSQQAIPLKLVKDMGGLQHI